MQVKNELIRVRTIYCVMCRPMVIVTIVLIYKYINYTLLYRLAVVLLALPNITEAYI